MGLRFFAICALILASFSVSEGSEQQSAEKYLQSGLYKEEVNGNIEEAIAIYQKVIKDFPEDRKVAAKAQLHIALCYEKLGL